jgi:hypothetical protein
VRSLDTTLSLDPCTEIARTKQRSLTPSTMLQPKAYWLGTTPLGGLQHANISKVDMVGGSGLEPLTSCVSSKYSNQLS